MAITKFYQSNYGKIAWDCFGADDNPSLVFIHGTPFSSYIWRDMIKALQSDFRIYVFDLLGYGQSEKIENPNLGIQNEGFAEIFEYWELENPIVVAHDFGGATALRAHFINRLDYKHLLLFDPVILSPWGTVFVQHVRENETAFANIPDYLHEAMLKAYLQTAAHKPLSDEAMKGYMQPWLGKIGKPAFYRQMAVMDEAYTKEIENQLEKIRSPVSLLWGENDDWLSLEQGKKLANIFKIPLTIVPNSGHMMQEDDPFTLINHIHRLA